MIANHKFAFAGGAVLAALLAACTAGSRQPAEQAGLALMTSLPIYWAESASISEALKKDAEPHWVRTELEEQYALVPVDTLTEADLAGYKRLLLAQPRPLSPEENVALDTWVRKGGQLLLFADPMLTEHSRFHIGDKRRPQDVVLLSPILNRWGLELQFDESQPGGERALAAEGLEVPVNLAGQFALRPTAPEAPATCDLGRQGLIATCRIGEGRATIVADAALLEQERAQYQGAPILDELLERAFR